VHPYLGEKITAVRGPKDRGAPEALVLKLTRWQSYDLFGETGLYCLTNRQE